MAFWRGLFYGIVLGGMLAASTLHSSMVSAPSSPVGAAHEKAVGQSRQAVSALEASMMHSSMVSPPSSPMDAAHAKAVGQSRQAASALEASMMHSWTISPRSSRVGENVETADDSDPPKQTVSAQEAQRKVEPTQTWVVLLAQQHSGTHWLTEQLNQHPCIDIQPEILCCNHTSWWPPALRRMAIQRFFDPAQVPSDMVFDGKKMPRVVEQYVQQSALRLKRGRSIRGFNWKIDQGFLSDWPDWFRPYAANHSMRILWVQRRNLLRRLVSGYANAMQHLAATTDQTVVKTIAEQKINIEPKRLLKHLNESSRENDSVSRYLKSNAVQYRRVYYEDLLNGLEDVWAFMLRGTACKAPAVKVASHYQQLHSGKLENFVQNWDEVREALSGTQWSHMLVE